jgi:hypothetical protein
VKADAAGLFGTPTESVAADIEVLDVGDEDPTAS